MISSQHHTIKFIYVMSSSVQCQKIGFSTILKKNPTISKLQCCHFKVYVSISDEMTQSSVWVKSQTSGTLNGCLFMDFQYERNFLLGAGSHSWVFPLDTQTSFVFRLKFGCSYNGCKIILHFCL